MTSAAGAAAGIDGDDTGRMKSMMLMDSLMDLVVGRMDF